MVGDHWTDFIIQQHRQICYPLVSDIRVNSGVFALQLFWEKRLQGLSASDVTEQIIKTMELPKGLQGIEIELKRYLLSTYCVPGTVLRYWAFTGDQYQQAFALGDHVLCWMTCLLCYKPRESIHDRRHKILLHSMSTLTFCFLLCECWVLG